MLPLPQRVAFLTFAVACIAVGFRGFQRMWRRIMAGQADTDARTNVPIKRAWYALTTTITQSRTFRDRPFVSFLHSWIFYGFTFYLLVNLVDAIDGFYELPLHALGHVGEFYLLLADLFSALVIVAVLALIVRRFVLPSRHDFVFNERTLLHEDVRDGYVRRDSIAVSAFILFHVGSRAMEMGAKLAAAGPDRYQPFAGLFASAISAQHAMAWRVAGYWGALGSVLAFLAYFPYSKHLHIFMAPMKYAVARDAPSGVLPSVALDIDVEAGSLGAEKLENLAWPRLLDAYACIQCNRCQDVCPATATGKSLSPSALEINKRMELNRLGQKSTGFEVGSGSPRPLLEFAMTPEAAWACTTCGACLQVCPVQDEPMLDIIDIRRQQVMMEGKFPAQLQSAFRGMERSRNPWGIAQENRLAWANGLGVRTAEENPEADVLYWVGCAASYDPQAQKTARALVKLLQHANVNFAVLGKKECCTGDSARRAGNEFLYRELAEQNIRTLNECAPKLIIATCPHCMNALGQEYPQLGGNYRVMHHTEFLDGLVQAGKLTIRAGQSNAVAFHDPCYLGRHNGIYEAPRNLLHVISNDVRELERNREGSFCCGAGGAQFWKEEEPGNEKISSNRMREAEETLASASGGKVVAVGCPFCKSMLQSTPELQSGAGVAVLDVAELLWARLESGSFREHGSTSAKTQAVAATLINPDLLVPDAPSPAVATVAWVNDSVLSERGLAAPSQTGAHSRLERPKWTPKRTQASTLPDPPTEHAAAHTTSGETPSPDLHTLAGATANGPPGGSNSGENSEPTQVALRAKWTPKKAIPIAAAEPSQTDRASPKEDQPTMDASEACDPHAGPAVTQRKKWPGKKA